MKTGLMIVLALSLSTCGSVAECGPSNCLGCCTASGLCDSGTSSSACGARGARCDVCIGGQSCSSFGSCAFGATGGGGGTGGGTGSLEPGSRWVVQPTQASIKSTNNGSEWDGLGGSPDPMVRLWCPSTAASSTHATPESQDTYYPTWTTGGCEMTAGDLQQLGFSYQVFDVDVSSNDPITQKYVVKPNVGSFSSRGFSFTDTDGLSSIQFSLSPR